MSLQQKQKDWNYNYICYLDHAAYWTGRQVKPVALWMVSRYTGSFVSPVKSNFLIGHDYFNGTRVLHRVYLTRDWEIYGFPH